MEPLRSGDGKKEEDREEDLEYSPFYGIEKGAVLQEARVFNEAHADPRKCQQVITKLLYLLTQGESLTKTEASDVFFAVTKLFQHTDVHLRRMVYLVIKEVIPASDEVIIITSSLMKDMNNANELYRANAIRVLCRIIDPSMLLQIERYLKQAVVDRSPVVAVAALAGALVLARAGGADVIRRWTSEVGEAMNSRQPMVVYQAVALAHALRASDRLAANKLVSQLTRAGGAGAAARSPLAQCLLVRYVAQVFLESCLRSKSEAVIFEAARAICALRGVTAKELAPAVTVLQLFLSSSKPALISDPNRGVATLAISALLKTSGEAGVERLLKQIGGFMSELGDEFCVVVVKAVAGLCVKFPAKHRALMAFLASALREDGGFAFKRAVVDALTRLVWAVPEAREVALGHLAEFIEDCEFTALSVRVLHLLGREGPRGADPARYVRVIYNRVVLENAAVRAAALSALRSFGARCEPLRARVVVLLRRALHDSDDEVRDRAALAVEEAAPLAAGAAPRRAPASLAAVPELADLPAVFASAGPFPLTEEETEYKVEATAHTLEDGERVVLEFSVANTVAEQVLEDVEVALELEEGWAVERELGLAEAPRDGTPGAAYAVLVRPAGAPLPAPARFGCRLRFVVKEIDPALDEPEEEGYPDEYELEDLELGLGAFVAPGDAPGGFRGAWEALPEESERVDEYALGARDDGIAGVVEAMQALCRAVRPVLARIAFGLDARREVAMKLAVRATDPDISEAVHLLIQNA
ncbi:hypothetical protein QBZ16_003883 [Prototheca wickerhamii]|uniref:Coatomer subunit gamma n=1 Tax=Prototheca wickerhamii TaxID=3111 RepID=A0AAD9MKF4_PROWI|nr:hypothetical protein QBZ16_003883 [Prototheca wickerhamii]